MKPFVYTLIALFFLGCSSISTPCYFGALPKTQQDTFNESISEILQKASSDAHIKKYTHEDYISDINKDLHISDSLTHPLEIRVYKSMSTTNYSSIFRMYKNDRDQWKAMLYEYYGKIAEENTLGTHSKLLFASSDMEFVFENLVRSYIFELPNIDAIFWKLVKRGKIQKMLQKRRGKVSVYYENTSTQISPLDGDLYVFQVYNAKLNKYHSFYYDNLERHLELYPDIDEIIYVNEIMEILKNEFNIWQGR